MSPLKDVYFYHKHLLENNLEIFCCPETFLDVNWSIACWVVVLFCRSVDVLVNFVFFGYACLHISYQIVTSFKASSASLYIFHLNTLFVYIWIVLNRESRNLNIRLCFKVILPCFLSGIETLHIPGYVLLPNFTYCIAIIANIIFINFSE